MGTQMEKVSMNKGLTIEYDREVDGRWIAEIPELPGCIVYGKSKSDAYKKVRLLALDIVAYKITNNEPLPKGLKMFGGSNVV